MKEQIDKTIRNVTVVYTDGFSERFEAIHLTEKGVVIDRIMNGKFVACGFVSNRNIKEIRNEGKRKGLFGRKFGKEETVLWDSSSKLKEEKK